ncbi:putative aminotransferase [Pseudomonas amygdali pv. eriobotryae]|uniref:Aminotransferase n=1 Tax=Pseudomonas amygdali pv. eriobotryae TaxID=129137 RepID=A0A9P3AH41_PSEA0|nr:aminotransferase class I/II-fold pyridoxal phosphate-dependent enzyme [Pseudomonas amygdali]GFZ62799.1 putative aminotransferase [Pseudomonas amygdali pv. eriobotryae]GFZ68145.1 putative aminotransferase [Pseudomonas amygdali pv. eriobotryae]
MKLEDLSKDELARLHAVAQSDYLRLCEKQLSISMARGVPSKEQLELSNMLLELPGIGDYLAEDGTDCRNYMGQQGLPEARKLFAPLLGVPEAQVVVNGNSSLALMYDCLSFAMRNGVPGSSQPWHQEKEVKFLCPVPGYDRHFSLCEAFGIRLIPISMLDDGPDVDEVRSLVANDPSIKGMWCVPKYSNPTGAVYSDRVVQALASMSTAARDFRLFWDDAYTVHHLTTEDVQVKNIYEVGTDSGNPDRALIFVSTSKITHAGSGLAMLGGSVDNIKWWLKHASVRSVGPDKISQLRHVRFIRNIDGLKTLMEDHRRLLKPRFDAVLEMLRAKLADYGFAQWSDPKGGYFISVNAYPGTAKHIVALTKAAGVQMTDAGACFPYGIDPLDRQLRIAPSSPSVSALRDASEVICASILLAACERRLG